jgi:hypothetical protein
LKKKEVVNEGKMGSPDTGGNTGDTEKTETYATEGGGLAEDNEKYMVAVRVWADGNILFDVDTVFACDRTKDAGSCWR